MFFAKLEWNPPRLDRLISKASLPKLLLNRSFSRRPNFNSTEFFVSGLNVANLMRYVSNAALFRSKISFCEEINFTECFIGSPYLLGPFFGLHSVALP